MERRCYRKILRILYRDHVTNEEVRGKIQQAIGPHEDDHRKETQTEVERTCLLFVKSGQNHLARHSERGKRTRQTEEKVGRQHQGMDRRRIHQVENREKWRKLVVKSSVVPQRPSWLTLSQHMALYGMTGNFSVPAVSATGGRQALRHSWTRRTLVCGTNEKKSTAGLLTVK